MTGAPTIAMRPVAPADARLLFDWVNRSDSLARKLNTCAPIVWEDHRRWLAERLDDPETAIWIAECDGDPVGQVRMMGEPGGLVIDIYVVAPARGRGVARAMLAQACAMAGERWPGRTVIARVRRDNDASLRLFAGAGFLEIGQGVSFVTLTREAL